MIATIFSLALAGAAVAADDNAAANAPKKYTPEIRGQLLDGTKPVTSNVCLRQSGSEIRMCGYTDFSGAFFIPAHSALPRPGDTDTPTWWLEIGRVTEARRIAPIDASEDRRAAIVLECNLARGGGPANTPGICERKSAVNSVATRAPKSDSAPLHPARPAKK